MLEERSPMVSSLYMSNVLTRRHKIQGNISFGEGRDGNRPDRGVASGPGKVPAVQAGTKAVSRELGLATPGFRTWERSRDS